MAQVKGGETMDSDMEKMMKEFEENNKFTAAKKYADQEVEKFVKEGGMDKYVKVDGEYREKEDIDGLKQKEEKERSKWFLISGVVILLVVAIMLARSVMDTGGGFL